MACKIMLIGLLIAMTVTGCALDRRAQSLMNLKLLSAEDYFKDSKEIEMAHAIEWDDTSKIQKLLDDGLNVNTKGYHDSMNFIMWAFIKQEKKSYQYLLEHGADPNQMTTPRKGKLNKSVMNEAVIPEDTFWLKLALEHGGDPNTPDNSQSIIFEAVRQERIENIKLLLKSGADINYQNKITKGTPILEAITRDNYNIATMLLEYGANPELNKRELELTITKYKTASFISSDDLKKKIEDKKKFVKKLQEKGLLKDYEVKDEGVYFETK